MDAMWDLKHKVVLITGAGMGMGRLFALQFARASATIVLADVNGDALKKTASVIKTGVHSYVCDVSDRNAVHELAGSVHRDAGPVDIIVNNAGVLYGVPFHQSPDESIERTIDINLKGAMLVTRTFLPDLLSKKQGHIINMASASSMTGVPDLAAYATSKHGMQGFSESLRLEMKKYGYPEIVVTLVFPHFVNTGMVKGVRSPVLLEPARVVEKTINAMMNNKLYVYLPWWLRFIPLLIALFPASASDWVLFKAGAHRTMERWVGHGDRK